MDKTARIFRSFAEAEQADAAYYKSLTPRERVELVLETVAQAYPDEMEQRSPRVYRIIKLSEH